MFYREITPPPDLAQYIRHFAILEEHSYVDKAYRIISDGCPGLIFQQKANTFKDRSGSILPQLFIHGVAKQFSEKSVKGSYKNLIIYFQPAALRSVFGWDASELTNKYIDLGDIFGQDLKEQLVMEQEDWMRIEILCGFVRKQLASNKKFASDYILPVIEQIKINEHETVISDIRRIFKLSDRTLERHFKTEVGITLKTYMRINRFQKALNQIRKGSDMSLTDLAYSHVYADQSHFTREFKEFCGMTPSHFLNNTDEQAINLPLLR